MNSTRLQSWILTRFPPAPPTMGRSRNNFRYGDEERKKPGFYAEFLLLFPGVEILHCNMAFSKGICFLARCQIKPGWKSFLTAIRNVQSESLLHQQSLGEEPIILRVVAGDVGFGVGSLPAFLFVIGFRLMIRRIADRNDVG